jgi:hypothetical protein
MAVKGEEEETTVLCYSSGTTGRGKGVETTHYNLTSQLQALHVVSSSSPLTAIEPIGSDHSSSIHLYSEDGFWARGQRRMMREEGFCGGLTRSTPGELLHQLQDSGSSLVFVDPALVVNLQNSLKLQGAPQIPSSRIILLRVRQAGIGSLTMRSWQGTL